MIQECAVTIQATVRGQQTRVEVAEYAFQCKCPTGWSLARWELARLGIGTDFQVYTELMTSPRPAKHEECQRQGRRRMIERALRCED